MESDYLKTNVEISSTDLHLLKYLLSSTKEILLALCKEKTSYSKFYVLLTVHLDAILDND
jgi:hypothetical protein